MYKLMSKALVLFLMLPSILWASDESAAGPKPVIEIYTDEWLPYINGENAPLSDDAVLVKMIALEAGYDLVWQYLPYGASYDLVRSGKALLSFPYFKTDKRAEEVVFSAPALKVVNQLYYNRQHRAATDFSADLSGYKMGQVAGYSYGEKLDQLLGNAQVYASERSAITALLNNQIDILPITEEVADATLERYFPNRRQLLATVPLIEPYQPLPLHIIAPATERGKSLIQSLNEAMARLQDRGVIAVTTRQLKRDKQPDFAELITSEGYPIILGQTHRDENQTRYYTLPNGTQVLVLEWSKRIKESSHTDRLYKNMVDLSRILVLNGPHVGKELFVKNMHIHLR